MTKIQRQKNRIIGEKIEQLALQWLIQQGLCLITQNYHCKTGEIDIIMSCAQQLVFVEVRYRSRLDYGGALESVDRTKQKKLLRAATFFLANNLQYTNYCCRFDVIAVQRNQENDTLQWTWVKDAFTA